MKLVRRLILWVCAVLISLLFIPVQAADDVQSIPWKDRTWEQKFIQSNYEDEFTPHPNEPERMVFFKDPFTWAISKEFAERFGMPKEWIDPELKGALAVAWRTTKIGEMMCGHGGNPNACWPPFTCQMDIYVDSKAPIPWRFNDVEREFLWDGLSSLDYVPRRGPAPRRARYAMINGAFGDKGRPLNTYGWKHKNAFYGAFNVIFFDKAYAPGVVLLGFENACPRDDTAASLSFLTDEENKLVKPKSLAHTIEFSEAFMKKIRAIYVPEYEESKKANSAYQQIIKRYAPNAK